MTATIFRETSSAPKPTQSGKRAFWGRLERSSPGRLKKSEFRASQHEIFKNTKNLRLTRCPVMPSQPDVLTRADLRPASNLKGYHLLPLCRLVRPSLPPLNPKPKPPNPKPSNPKPQNPKPSQQDPGRIVLTARSSAT